jgi:hypothetical protein
MPVPQMRLVDEHVGAGPRSLDRALEAERGCPIGRVVAKKDAQ